ncbi:MAG: hypothetical protein ABIJ59_08955 [Pseudomonadota bacterium]
MKNKCTQYTSEQISQFVDNELARDLFQALDDHQKVCPDCRDLIHSYQTMSNLFSNHADQQILKINSNQSADKLKLVLNKTAPNFFESTGKRFGKNIYLKLASIVAIMVISLVAFQGRLVSPVGPSAIVESIDTDYASVMIIETEKQKHTIIWISET